MARRSANALYPASWARTLFDPNDGAIVLSLRKRNESQRAHLTPACGIFWRELLKGRSFDEACRVVLEEFGITDLEMVKRDMTRLMEGILTKCGLLANKPGKAHFENASWPQAADDVDMVEQEVADRGLLLYQLLCASMWVPTWVLSRIRWDIMEQILIGVRQLRPEVASPERSDMLVASARYIGRWNPSRNVCLETSLQVFLVGALTGTAPRLCIGTGFPIKFHTWVENSLGQRVREPTRVDGFGAIIRV